MQRAIATVKPVYSPSYFTGRPIYYDSLLELNKLLRSNNVDITASADNLDSTAADKTSKNLLWMDRRSLMDLWQARLTDAEYQAFALKLTRLHENQQQLQSTDNSIVKRFLARYAVKGEIGDSDFSRSSIRDEMGRIYGVGQRRRVKAHTWLVEAHDSEVGQVWIDGRRMGDVLSRMKDRHRVYLPFGITDTSNRFNVWVETENSLPPSVAESINHQKSAGGGPTALSGAVSNGIANALCKYQPAMRQYLEECGLTSVDERQRERKKPGQPSARAKFAWVKR